MVSASEPCEEHDTEVAGTGVVGPADEKCLCANPVFNSGRKDELSCKVAEVAAGTLAAAENDVNVVVRVELWPGVGRGSDHAAMAMAGMGTGVGTASDGLSHWGWRGVVGEPGYSNADFGG